MLKRLLGLSRRQKQVIAVATDFVLLVVAFWSALVLRFETVSPDLTPYRWLILAAPLAAIPVFVRLGLYRAVIRFMEDRVVLVVGYGVTLSVLLMGALLAFSHTQGVSRGVIGIYWLLAILYVGASRFLVRGYLLGMERKQDRRRRIAIYGAGRAGTQLAFALLAGREYLPVAMFDDKSELQSTELAGLRVYSPHNLPEVISDLEVAEIFLAIPSASKARRVEVISRLERLHCKLKIIPGMADIVNGQVSAETIREVEIEDLLGREVVVPEENLLDACIRGKSVMVSGAGGSIGSELCRQIIRLQPHKLVLLELSEFALYSIEQELSALCARLGLKIELVPLLGSVAHRERNESVMRCFGVQTVYHAAAYKHVPLVEHNPIEGLRNNAIGTRHMAEAALAAGVETFVLISTDKAVRPTNVMGASKRLAELVLQALAHQGGSTRFCMVRFGNVLGSSGSVVPLFRKQILKGGPITVTHPEVTRYFMTIPEAAQLVIQAGSMGQGGEVYVLDMGLPVKIVDLARRMIHLSGLEVRDAAHPEGEIAIEIVGLRPGEKLYEELLIGDNVERTGHPLIMRAFENELPWLELCGYLQQLDAACEALDYGMALGLLRRMVKEYEPVRHGEEELTWRLLDGSVMSQVGSLH